MERRLTLQKRCPHEESLRIKDKVARLLQLRIRLLIGDSHEPFRQLSGIL